MSSLAIIIIVVLSATLIYVWAKCQSLQKEVHSKENKENELKKLALVLQNINAYFLLIDKDFVVCDTNYYSLNRLPIQVGGVTKRVGDLLHCRNAIAAGECGQHEQCKLCCIRASIGKAFYKKASFKNLEASMKLLSEDEATVTPCDVSVSGTYLNIHGQDYMVLTVYDVTELEELSLAYAVTIHKAQGSEYPIVVMPFTMSHFVMLQRNLLYTGVTRAKKILVLVGEKKAVYYAIKNETTAGRNTCLARRLQENSRESKEAQFADKTSKEKMIVYKGGIQPSMICETPTVYEGDLWKRLSQSKFRSSFSLKANDRNYVSEKGMAKVREHAIDFISKRLAPANLPNDGRQTPMRGHPVFVAQHATATCCRGCLEKWHHIPKGRELTWEEQEYVVDVIMEWISREMKK